MKQAKLTFGESSITRQRS